MNNSNSFPNKYKKMIAIPLIQQNVWNFSPNEQNHSNEMTETIIFENIKNNSRNRPNLYFECFDVFAQIYVAILKSFKMRYLIILNFLNIA
jgi:hypothetical protein